MRGPMNSNPRSMAASRPTCLYRVPTSARWASSKRGKDCAPGMWASAYSPGLRASSNKAPSSLAPAKNTSGPTFRSGTAIAAKVACLPSAVHPEHAEQGEHIGHPDVAIAIHIPEAHRAGILHARPIINGGICIVVDGIEVGATQRIGVRPVASIRRKGAGSVVKGSIRIIIAGPVIRATSVFNRPRMALPSNW